MSPASPPPHESGPASQAPPAGPSGGLTPGAWRSAPRPRPGLPCWPQAGRPPPRLGGPPTQARGPDPRVPAGRAALAAPAGPAGLPRPGPVGGVPQVASGSKITDFAPKSPREIPIWTQNPRFSGSRPLGRAPDPAPPAPPPGRPRRPQAWPPGRSPPAPRPDPGLPLPHEDSRPPAASPRVPSQPSSGRGRRPLASSGWAPRGHPGTWCAARPGADFGHPRPPSDLRHARTFCVRWPGPTGPPRLTRSPPLRVASRRRGLCSCRGGHSLGRRSPSMSDTSYTCLVEY